jgi:DNA-directed RNA polymerase subunit RPC12/RpoP
LGRREENRSFRCAVCGHWVPPLQNGSYRNHCPRCLASRHVDVRPGDRAATCGGVMLATGIIRSKKGWQIVHRCEQCGALRRNRIAEHDPDPDDIDALIALCLMP